MRPPFIEATTAVCRRSGGVGGGSADEEDDGLGGGVGMKDTSSASSPLFPPLPSPDAGCFHLSWFAQQISVISPGSGIGIGIEIGIYPPGRRAQRSIQFPLTCVRLSPHPIPLPLSSSHDPPSSRRKGKEDGGGALHRDTSTYTSSRTRGKRSVGCTRRMISMRREGESGIETGIEKPAQTTRGVLVPSAVSRGPAVIPNHIHSSPHPLPLPSYLLHYLSTTSPSPSLIKPDHPPGGSGASLSLSPSSSPIQRPKYEGGKAIMGIREGEGGHEEDNRYEEGGRVRDRDRDRDREASPNDAEGPSTLCRHFRSIS
ncbi:hypothetical protein F4775DRAFT_267046 [Biscogniauxia sp. FL1348]|nr:hypothetical protein F4775DRAFT_267046 [Biscogniauxia sp. FL1348]